MATRFYLPASAASTPITPTPDAAWEDTSILARAMTSTAVISDAMATVSFSDADETNKDILFRQWISEPLTAGQTITGSQALKAQVRGSERLSGNNLFLTLGIRVIAANGTTVQKVVLAPTRDDVELTSPLATLTNRQFTATSAATNYTTVEGDRLCIELGTGGDPITANPHDSALRLGDAAAVDLAENNTATTDDNPWAQLTDTLTFSAAAVPTDIGAAFSAPELPEALMLPY